MSADTNDRIAPAAPSGESQGQRWAKYGSNVVLMVVLAVVLAGLITYIAQAHDLRVDTTAQGVNSLRPQTMSVLHNLGSDIKLVSLYAKAENTNDTSSPEGSHPIDKARMVSDLLDNYHRANSRITVEAIDPADKGKVDALIADLDERYGKDIKNYREYMEDYNRNTYKKLSQLIGAEQSAIGPSPLEDTGDDVAAKIRGTIGIEVRALEDTKKATDRLNEAKRPEYRRMTDAIKEMLDGGSRGIVHLEQTMLDYFAKNKDDAKTPENTRKYMTDSIPRHEAIKKLAEEQVARIDKLGELKVDELAAAAKVHDPILVLGPTDWRVLSESQVWPENKNLRGLAEGKVVPNFAGEQQITTAILSLTAAHKPKVAFIRPGGAPLTSPGFPPFQQGGPFSEFGERLRDYNFDVLEKDLSGQWAMQSQMRGMPPTPEPSWEELNDAVWVVIDAPAGSPQQPSEPIGSRLAAHLGHGGSAVVLVFPGGDNLDMVLRDWGVELHPDLTVVHEQIPAPANPNTADVLQQALRVPYIWDFHDYGNADLARPLKNLDSLFVYVTPVKTHDVRERKVTPLLPIPGPPQAPASWATKKDPQALQDATNLKFEKDDINGPLFGGAVSEKPGGGRLVALGSGMFATDQFLQFPNIEIARTEGRFVAQFPGNGELAANSVFWCAKMDSMIALSPAALQVSRISDIGPVTLNIWRWGILLFALPVLVIAAGVGMYFNRRD